MRRRVADEDVEQGLVNDEAGSKGTKRQREGEGILTLLLIAFILSAAYLYSFGGSSTNGAVASENGGAPIKSSSTSSLPAASLASAALAPAPSPLVPVVAPAGCLTSIPEVDSGRHIVKPPSGPVVLVCCQTTKGVWNIAVHKTWAPIGAENFLNMVTSGFFSSKVGLFRSLKGFLIQFGLAGEPAVQKKFEETMLKGKHGNLPDDPQWLPAGPPGREINGVRRFQKGYFAYAGAGKNSRGTQLIVAFEDNLYLGGGSPWEVPWGQLVGDASFETLKKIYTGYGEAPSQGKIRNRGNQYLEAEYPLLDFINECVVVRENVPWKSTITYIAPPPTTQAQT